MTWIKLLRRQLPLICDDIIGCPGDFFGENAPDIRKFKCTERGLNECWACWASEVPSDVLAAHGIEGAKSDANK